MKKRVVNVTKVSKKVDKRLEALETRLHKIINTITNLEKVIIHNNTKPTAKKISYKIEKKT